MKNLRIFFDYGEEKKKKSYSCLWNKPGKAEIEVEPGLTLKTQAIQQGDKLEFSIALVPSRPTTLQSLRVEIPFHFDPSDTIYLNGFQSWTDSREWKIQERMKGMNPLYLPVTRHYQMHKYGDYKIVSYSGKKGHFHAFSYTYLRKDKSIILLGSLSEKAGYTIFHHETPLDRIVVQKECEGMKVSQEMELLSIVMDTGEESRVFADYFASMGLPSPKSGVCTGWTSWYNYYEKITEDIILQNVQAFRDKKIPIDVFQIDDGYQKAVGDWLVSNEKFPDGMKRIAERIHEAGYQAGLWLAPFICEEKSEIAKKHPDWILRDSKGKKVIAGYNPFNWSGNSYALDFYNSEVQDYLKKVFRTVLREWHFDLVKLDFLYAVALIPHHGHSRGYIMDKAMSFLRKLAKDKKILGCGVPLGPAYGKVDYCRIGSDVAPYWEDERLVQIRYRERVSTYNSLSSTLGRHHLNGNVFYNDPDVFILREKNQQMTKNQRKTLFLVNLILGGLVFTSDNIAEYSPEEMNQYLSIFPMKPKNIRSVVSCEKLKRIEFGIEGNEYLVFANLGENRETVKLPEGDYFEKSRKWLKGDTSLALDTYDSLCLLKVPLSEYAVVGSENHLFPGSEIASFTVEKGKIEISFDSKTQLRGTVYIRVPPDVHECEVNDELHPAQILWADVKGVLFSEK